MIGTDRASEIYDKICEIFGTPQEQNSSVLLEAIQRGNIGLDETKRELIYALQSPVDQVTHLRFGEPDLAQLERINKGIVVSLDEKNRPVVNMATLQETRTIRAISILSGVPIGTVEKIKRKDYLVLREIMRFFE